MHYAVRQLYASLVSLHENQGILRHRFARKIAAANIKRTVCVFITAIKAVH